MIGSTVFKEKIKAPMSPKLSLVALMDIFTILVFFLLLNNGESNKIENAKFVHLPDSTTGERPHEDLLIHVGAKEIWLNDKAITTIDKVAKSGDEQIEPLAEALASHAEKRVDLNEFEKRNGLSVTIMGDKSVSYSLLKSVMTTCQATNFRNISLAVNQIIGRPPAGAPAEQAAPAKPPSVAKVGG